MPTRSSNRTSPNGRSSCNRMERWPFAHASMNGVVVEGVLGGFGNDDVLCRHPVGDVSLDFVQVEQRCRLYRIHGASPSHERVRRIEPPAVRSPCSTLVTVASANVSASMSAGASLTAFRTGANRSAALAYRLNVVNVSVRSRPASVSRKRPSTRSMTPRSSRVRVYLWQVALDTPRRSWSSPVGRVLLYALGQGDRKLAYARPTQ